MAVGKVKHLGLSGQQQSKSVPYDAALFETTMKQLAGMV